MSTYTMPSRSVILVVISFLLVTSIYSSFAKIDVLGKTVSSACHYTGYPGVEGQPWTSHCCWKETRDKGVLANNAAPIRLCQDCNGVGNPIATAGVGNGKCSAVYRGDTAALPPAGPEQAPPSTPPKNALPSSQPTTCPDGSAPDANGKCPPVTQGDSGSKEKEKNPKSPIDTGGAGLAVSDEGAPGKKPVKK